MTLPEAVERQIIAFDGTDRQRVALRSAILAYGAARERQGIERAAQLVASNDLLTPHMGPLFGAGWAEANKCAAATLRALPVDGATP